MGRLTTLLTLLVVKNVSSLFNSNDCSNTSLTDILAESWDNEYEEIADQWCGEPPAYEGDVQYHDVPLEVVGRKLFSGGPNQGITQPSAYNGPAKYFTVTAIVQGFLVLNNDVRVIDTLPAIVPGGGLEGREWSTLLPYGDVFVSKLQIRASQLTADKGITFSLPSGIVNTLTPKLLYVSFWAKRADDLTPFTDADYDGYEFATTGEIVTVPVFTESAGMSATIFLTLRKDPDIAKMSKAIDNFQKEITKEGLKNLTTQLIGDPGPYVAAVQLALAAISAVFDALNRRRLNEEQTATYRCSVSNGEQVYVYVRAMSGTSLVSYGVRNMDYVTTFWGYDVYHSNGGLFTVEALLHHEAGDHGVEMIIWSLTDNHKACASEIGYGGNGMRAISGQDIRTNVFDGVAYSQAKGTAVTFQEN